MADDQSISNNLISAERKSNATRIQIVPSTPKTLSHLPTRPAVDLAFHNLTYRVKEGRKNSEYYFFLFYFISCFIYNNLICTRYIGIQHVEYHNFNLKKKI